MRQSVKYAVVLGVLGFVVSAPAGVVAEVASPFPGFDKLRSDRKAAAAYMLQRLDAYWKGEAGGQPARTAKIIYFHSADRAPHARYEGRITGWFDDFNRFFRDEFKKNGFGERQLALERTPEGGVNIHRVKGAKPEGAYSYDSGREIFAEVREGVKSKFDLGQETALIICGLSNTQGDGMVRIHSPFYGLGGSQDYGICLCADHELMDVKNFTVKDRKVTISEHRARKMSLGGFNTTYLGGALHEFGHSLSLPHDDATDNERPGGSPLMGDGNYTYRSETRGDGRFTYLSFSEAVRLIAHPLFSGHSRDLRTTPTLSHGDISFVEKSDRLLIRGQLKSNIPAYAVIAYNDRCPAGCRSNSCKEDYDAQTWTSVVNEKGEFEIKIGKLLPGTVELRLTVCHMNGGTTTLRDVPKGYLNHGKGKPLEFYGAPAKQPGGVTR